ncbi:hypothetical protein [Paenibacillus sp. JCM 10914]
MCVACDEGFVFSHTVYRAVVLLSGLLDLLKSDPLNDLFQVGAIPSSM